MSEPLRAAIPMLQIWVPSLAAAALMATYLLRMHPQMRREMNEWVDEDDSPDEMPGPVKSR